MTRRGAIVGRRAGDRERVLHGVRAACAAPAIAEEQGLVPLALKRVKGMRSMCAAWPGECVESELTPRLGGRSHTHAHLRARSSARSPPRAARFRPVSGTVVEP